jgi:BON domain
MQNWILSRLLKLVAFALVLTTASVSAYAQTPPINDAQVEANVLKALAQELRLAEQEVGSSTTSGIVTLTGTVADPSDRDLVEQIVARTAGVTKVIDQLAVGGIEVAEATNQNSPIGSQQSGNDNYPGGGRSPNDGQAPPYSPQSQQQPGYGDPNQRTTGDSDPAPTLYGALSTPQGAAQQGLSSPIYSQQAGQIGGQQVVLPAGQMISVRINRWLSSGEVQPGTNFDATVMTDVIAGGAIAIPRGADIQGTVVDSKSAGVVVGRGSLSLELTNVSLGGKVFPLTSEPWVIGGHDKTLRSVNSTLGFGALGAVLGGVAGGGAGAAIGAGAGAAVGLGSSAASGDGQAVIPAEAPISFRLVQEAQIITVGQAEMGRLASVVNSALELPPPTPAYVYPPYPYPYVYPYPTVVVGVGYGRPYRYRAW